MYCVKLCYFDEYWLVARGIELIMKLLVSKWTFIIEDLGWSAMISQVWNKRAKRSEEYFAI